MKWLLMVCAALLLVTGCSTHKEMVIESSIVHDTLIVHRDSFVYRASLDSVSEKERVVIETRRDTINHVDSVFITTTKERNHIIQKTDTVYLVKDKYRSLDDMKDSKKEVKKEKSRFPWGWLITGVVCVVIFLIASKKD